MLRSLALTLILTALTIAPASAFFFATTDTSLHASPSSRSGVAGAVSEGAPLAVLKCQDKWCLVATGKKTGWLEVQFIGVAADAKSAPPGLPFANPPPVWRPDPLDPREPLLGPRKGQLAVPGVDQP